MGEARHLTAIIEREGDGFVALSPELDIASQGQTIEEARANLIEALTLFFEAASASEVSRRFRKEVFVTQVESLLGKLRVLAGAEKCMILEHQGFAPVRQRSSHRITLPSIIRQSELAKVLFETE